MEWINWSAVGKILGVGLLCGAGLPVIFTVGLRLMSPHQSGPMAVGGPNDGAAAAPARAGAPAMALAGLCFAVVLAAIGYGIYLIVSG